MPDEGGKAEIPDTVAARDLGLTMQAADPPAADVVSLPVVAPEHYAVEGEVARGGMGRILLASYQSLLASRGATHERTVEARQRLAALYQAWKKPEKAAGYRQR